MLSLYRFVLIQCVPGGKDLTSGECSLGQTIPKNLKTPISKVQWLRRYWPEKSVDFFGVCVLHFVRDVITLYFSRIPTLSLDAAHSDDLGYGTGVQCIVVGIQWTTMTSVRVFL